MAKSNDTLLSLCHIIFTKKVATAEACVTPERLPPSPATRFHSQRVYFQIMVWMGMANEMNSIKWRWKQENDQLIPEKNVVPEKLLKIIHCNCYGGCKSSRCSCRRQRLPCTAACDPCQTENYDNSNYTQEVDTEEENTLKTERSETYLMDKGVCALGDSRQLKVMNSVS